MKIMWINPLGKPDGDETIAALIKDIKSTETVVEVVSLDTSPSPDDLEYRTYEALFYTDIIRLVRYAANNHYDAQRCWVVFMIPFLPTHGKYPGKWSL